jgi:hypothetical protein
MAVHAIGDCHPRVEGSTIALFKTNRAGGSAIGRAVQCEAKAGVSSRCVVKNNDISIEHEGTAAGAGYAIGVDCRGLGCAEVSSNRISLREVSGCDRSCWRAAYGVAHDSTIAPSGNLVLIDNVLQTSCTDSYSQACWDDIALYRYFPP